MVRSIKDNGKLAITKVGGPCLPTLDGEYCKIYTRDGKVYTGTILSCSPSVHVYPDASTLERNYPDYKVETDYTFRAIPEGSILSKNNIDNDLSDIALPQDVKDFFSGKSSSAFMISDYFDYRNGEKLFRQRIGDESTDVSKIDNCEFIAYITSR